MKYIIWLFLFSSIIANNEIDSLNKLLNNADNEKRYEVLTKLINISYKQNDTLKAIKYSDMLISELNKSRYPGKINYYFKPIEVYKNYNRIEKFENISSDIIKKSKNYNNSEFRKIFKLLTDYYYKSGLYNKNIRLVKQLFDASYHKKELSSQAIFVKSLAQNYILTGELDSAEIFANKNIELRLKLKDTAALGHAYNALGVIYWKKGDLLNAHLSYTKAEYFCIAGKDTSILLLTLNNLGLVFQRLKYYQRAEEYMQRGLVFAKQKQDYYGTAYTFRRLADLYLEINQFDKAKMFLDYSLEYYKLAKRDLLLTDVYYLYGKLYQSDLNFKEALKYYNMGLNNKDKILDKFVIALLLTKRSEIYLIDKKYDLALKDAEEALEISSGNRYSVIQRDNYFNLYKINKALKNFEKAVDYLEKYNQLKEKILNENIVNLINERDIKSSIEKSTEISRRLKKENELQKTIIDNNKKIYDFYRYLALIIGISFIVISYQLYKVRKLNKEIKIKNQNLLSVNDELVEKNSQLALANDTKHKLFSIIAHDLKNPFFSIIGFATIIKEHAEKSGLQEIKEHADILLFSSQSLVDMIDNLSKWARLQQESITPNYTNFNVVDEINSIINQNNLNVKLKEITIETEFNIDTAINADKEMTKTIIRNLFSNSIKFTPNGGSIFIGCKKENGNLVLSVKDSGRGISEDVIKAILNDDKINSVKGTNNEKGSGIGLKVCKDFIAAQKGSLAINGNLGKGAEFIVTLPLN